MDIIGGAIFCPFSDGNTAVGGTIQYQMVGNATLWSATNEAWKISPAGPPAYIMKWFQNGIPLATNVDSVNVCDPLPKLITAELTLTCPNKVIVDSIITVQQDYCCDCYFPNAFTPNLDGNNDVFRAITPATDKVKYELQVYNSWGARVFSTNQVEGYWNGNYKGEPAPIGSYYFQCKLKCENKEDDVYIKGDIMLIR